MPSQPSCSAAPDAYMCDFLARAAPDRLLPVSFDLSGPLFCGCSVTVLDCAAGPTAADDGATRRVYPSPRDAILVPAVSCPKGSSAVMKIFFGESCPVWRNDSAFNPFGCWWDNVNQARQGARHTRA